MPFFIFSLFLLMVLLLSHEADAVICQLTSKYVIKTEKSFAVVCGCMCNCISLPLFEPLQLSLRLLYSCWLHEFYSSSLARWCRSQSLPSVFTPSLLCSALLLFLFLLFPIPLILCSLPLAVFRYPVFAV